MHWDRAIVEGQYATRQFDQRSNHALINEVMAISLATTI